MEARAYNRKKKPMDILFVPLFHVTSIVLSLYLWTIIAAVLLHWLTAFGVINPHNSFVRSLEDFFDHVTDPLLGPLRRTLPLFGGVDLSPLAAILIIIFLRGFVDRLLLHMGA